jgi:hypothetical protein
MFYAYAQACPTIQPHGPARAPQCQTCRNSFLKYRTGWFYAHAQTILKIQPRGATHAPQFQTCRSSFLKYRTGWFMRMRILVLESNHVAHSVHHNAKLVAILS